MPYIAIKSYPKDEETKRAFVEKLNETLLEIWGCPPQAVTVSIEEIAKEDWEEKVKKPEILPKMDCMYIVSGEKKY